MPKEGFVGTGKSRSPLRAPIPYGQKVPLPLLLPFTPLGSFLTGLSMPWLMLNLSLLVLCTRYGYKVYSCLVLHLLGSLHHIARLLRARLRPGSPLRSWPPFALLSADRSPFPLGRFLASVLCLGGASAVSSALVPLLSQKSLVACSSLGQGDQSSSILRLLVYTSLKVTSLVG